VIARKVSPMSLLPSQNNFADLREAANKLAHVTKNADEKRLAEMVGLLAYRCDLLERELERLERVRKS
jgi:uncharacterized protein YicC (UPF0701 family)